MENLFFLALVAVIGLIRLVAQAAEKKRNADAAKRAQPQPDAPLQRAPAESEEQRIRRFMEALGVPQGAVQPPRKVTPRAKPILPIDPFPVPRMGGDIAPAPPPPVITVEPTPPMLATPRPLQTATTSMVAAAKETSAATTEFIVRDIPADTSSSVRPTGGNRAPLGIGERLASPEGLRDAVILREIFGPPRSMQPANFDSVL